MDYQIKIVYSKQVKVIIYTVGFAKVMINLVVRYHSLLESIISDQGSIFISTFWFLLCCFLDIKQKLFTAFYLQINRKNKR